MTLPIARSDTMAENATHVDTGCTVNSIVIDSCLACPLPMCKYDDPGWLSRESRLIRDDAIARRRNDGERVVDLAKEYGLSERTVHRIIVQQREGFVSTYRDEFEGQIITVAQLERKSLYKTRAKVSDFAPR